MKNNWQTKKLGDVCDIVTGNTPKTIHKEYYGEDILWAGPSDLDKDIFVINTNKKLSKIGVSKGGARIVPAGSVLLSCIGNIGKIGIAIEDMSTNQQINSFVPDKNILNSKFLYYALITKVEDFKQASSKMTLPIINKTKCANIEISLPPLSEQKRIVKILDEAFEKLEKVKENTEKNLQNSKELFESYLNNIFSNSGKDWGESTLGEIYDVRDGTHDSPRYQKDGFMLITSKNLKNSLIDYKNVKYISEKDYININKRSRVDKGDILLAMIGTIGNPVVVDVEPNFAIKNVALFKINKNQESYFLKYLLESKIVIDKIKSDAKGTTQKFVGLGYLRNFPIRIPSQSEQKKIVKKLDQLSEKTQKLETLYKQKLENIEELKKSILSKAFSRGL